MNYMPPMPTNQADNIRKQREREKASREHGLTAKQRYDDELERINAEYHQALRDALEKFKEEEKEENKDNIDMHPRDNSVTQEEGNYAPKQTRTWAGFFRGEPIRGGKKNKSRKTKKSRKSKK